MAAITASLVKELREQSGAGMMDCKKALTETDIMYMIGKLSLILTKYIRGGTHN